LYREIEAMYRPGAPGQTSVKLAFFSQKNREMLFGGFVQDFMRITGSPLNDRQKDRLERTMDHYIEEVYGAQGEKPLAILNREVQRVTAADFSSYLQRQETVRTQPIAPVKVVANTEVTDALFQDTGRRFELMQTERQEVRAQAPAVPDFRIPLDDEGPTSVDLFEAAKRAREQEALRIANAPNTISTERISQRVAADDSFRESTAAAARATELALVERSRNTRPIDLPLIVPPDRRELMGPLGQPSLPLEIAPNSTRLLGIADGNPTTTIAQLQSPDKVNLPQDYVVREERVVSYKEIENNLFIWSADRNWLRKKGENRYNFSVTFDPAAYDQGYGISPRVQEKFKNITRIEFVKAILPVEGLTVMVDQANQNTSRTSYQNTVLSLPYVTVGVQELENNNYGSDNFLDRAFAVLQYDANWYSDAAYSESDSRGFTALIPKFMKCQKIYHPTPLSTLQKLTIDIRQPNGQLVSNEADTLDISEIYIDGTGGFTGVSPYNSNKYIYIQTTKYFSRFQVAVGDTLRIANFTWNTATLDANAGLSEFAGWINSEQGHLAVNIAYGSSGSLTVGPNDVGYANWIIIDARYADPTTGATGVSGFSSNISGFNSSLEVPRRLININRQVQLVFRVITRELDPTAQIRPDNLE
jgi:hypothetical protein